ncbi:MULTISPECIES: transcriptional repressor LexA [unclassified Methyloversatilis]|jgi:repressor LexA|uniref:transcriptional repressor LexA n=1 Tax=unclassified Methyloversatilis TaxID=2639971 RepID=UPI00211BC5D4|nr:MULTISPECIES: transcriptional repressor LexA [unclassified Methyloversatilis]MCQ9379427.1 transcriptional repressor LexA [Methyloversatilis sp. XJ19-49]MDP2870702.1 transcriptional repressor LexA [Methyloversatilis sp.]MDP3288671.1 transcriptional repressor LexA [Methyloversatilis sp.]MDP3455654.1 transcriptional repressor LexA [Methyloversatilis sp.]MDP3577515.1 transcriptional repressor LexA [Methyloversatilis sp.]
MVSSVLTARQQQILQLIRDAVSERGSPPTRAEIAQAFGFRSPNAAESHLRALARKGVISLDEGRARGIRLTESPGIPLIGRVAAGSPILADAHVQGRYQLDPAMFSPRADYLLRVRGQSMRDAGILDGDLLAIHATNEAVNGQIIVARLSEEVTVKRLKRLGSRVELLPENPEFQPIVIDTQRDPLVIEGVVVGLIRNGSPV